MSTSQRQSRPLPVYDPTGQPEIHERADATRNRLRALAAAERLFAQRGVATVTMDDIAAEAGVGKGTLYRRFGDKSGLAAALLGEREREFQGQMLHGPPPLGPGAPGDQRLAAFVTAYLQFVETHLDLVEMLETSAPGARFRTGVHRLWVTHCRILLESVAAPNPGLRAEILLAALTAEQVRYWRFGSHAPMEEIASALVAAALALTR